jgi:hypothetical protein
MAITALCSLDIHVSSPRPPPPIHPLPMVEMLWMYFFVNVGLAEPLPCGDDAYWKYI